ncbi:MAG TPA: hypothetical protein VEI96_00740 [Thermodesulfovibrionales bacterium]|nr:hypothetical protein [Thermodesulfovibrionales bacterium]
MFKKAVFITMLLLALSFGTAFALNIDSMSSRQTLADPTALPSGTPVNVFVNPGGLGDVLIYGYYNVRNNNEVIFTVTNTATVGARVRIRFREAATLVQTVGGPTIPGCDNGSQEVLDFDICLTKNDMWTGQIQSDSNGAGRLFSTDTDTFIQASVATAGNPNPAVIFPTAFPGGVEFKFGTSNLGITADQTREGYFEILGERQLSSACGTTGLPDCTCGDLLDVDANGAPIDTVATGGGPAGGVDVANVLMGHAYIVNLGSSATFAYAATALADFANADISNSLTSARPNLKQDSESGDIGPVNYALTKSAVMSIYDVEAGLNGKTELIVNFPTKWATHVDFFESEENECDPGPLGTSAEEVGNDIFDDPRVAITVFDDAEHSPTSSCQFSPCPPGTEVKLPHEINLIDINGSGIFTSDVVTKIATAFDFGWIKINLTTGATGAPAVPHLTACDASDGPPAICSTDGTDPDPGGGSAVSHGLPAIGYAVMTFGGSDFSGLIPLQYTTQIDPETL